MLGNEKGFTLIELIIVIVILGILSVVAIPKYQDLRGDAAKAAADGVFGAAEGASAVNFASRLVSPARSVYIGSIGSLILAMGGTEPVGWTKTATSLTDPTGAFTITVPTTELPATAASVPTSRAVIAKTW